MRLNSPEKDMMISQLKSQIFEFEQNEKNFNGLQSKFRALQNDFDLVSEEKLRLEYELKQRTELLNKQMAELRNDKENLQNNLNEKLALNKKLFNDNNNLFRTLESRNAEIEGLREGLMDCEEANSKLNEEKNSLEKNLNNVSDVKKSQDTTIVKYQNEIDKFNKICDEQDSIIKNLSEEKNDVIGRNDELNFELKNALGKLKSKEEGLNFTSRQLEESNKSIAKLEDNIVDLEQSLNRTKMELNNVSNAHAKERSNRVEGEKNGEKLESILKERTNEIKRLSAELDNARINVEKLNGEKARLIGEVERYKNHIMVLTEQNQKVNDNFNFFYIIFIFF